VQNSHSRAQQRPKSTARSATIFSTFLSLSFISVISIIIGFFISRVATPLSRGIFILYIHLVHAEKEQVEKAGRAGAFRKLVVHFLLVAMAVGASDPAAG
jgi:hypothetical protein